MQSGRVVICRFALRSIAQVHLRSRRDITYYVYQKESSYRGNGYQTNLGSHRLVLQRGKTVSGIFFKGEFRWVEQRNFCGD